MRQETFSPESKISKVVSALSGLSEHLINISKDSQTFASFSEALVESAGLELRPVIRT